MAGTVFAHGTEPYNSTHRALNLVDPARDLPAGLPLDIGAGHVG